MPEVSNPAPTASGPQPRAGPIYFLSAMLFLDFIIAVVMLYTDQNLQTDFGIVKPYYIHWWGVLAIALMDLLLATGVGTSISLARKNPSRVWRVLSKLAFTWAILVLVVMVGAVATYQQVGFSSETEWAKYLFLPSFYPGALPYIPWLYDAMLILTLVTIVSGWLAIRSYRPSLPTPAAKPNG